MVAVNHKTYIVPSSIDFMTEWIKYMGSKKEILQHIWRRISSLPIKSVFDWFAWTTRVGQLFNNNWIPVISNDLNIWSSVFWKTFLLNKTSLRQKYIDKISYLNSLKWYVWFYSENYGGIDNNGSSVQYDGKKKLWQLHNTMKLDAIRDAIEVISTDDIEKSTLLTALILALDKVDSSLWHFSSYLKERSPRSYKDLTLELPRFLDSQNENTVLEGDVFSALPHITSDLAYYDPPYWSNNDKMPSSRVRYGQYYHIWETIIRHDKPMIVWAINKRADATVERTYSVFEDYNKDWDFFLPEIAIFNLIKQTHSPYILLSYNTNGRASIQNIINFLDLNKYSYEIDHIWYKKNVMAGMKWTYDWDNLGDRQNHEILLLIYNK